MPRPLISVALVALALIFAKPVFPGPPEELAATLDEEFVRINGEVPGFGGLFHDENGTPHVYLTDLSQKHRVKRFGKGVRILKGDYEFFDLQKWRLRLRALFHLPGVVTLDVDESRNRLRVGVTRPSASEASADVLAELARLEIPGKAVEIVETDPFLPLTNTPLVKMSSVQESFNPVPGGVEIGALVSVCTLGFNVRFIDGGACYFLTADHCSNVSGVTENTQFFQSFSGPAIGIEKFDPPFLTGGSCPPGFVCRYSDATLAVYDDPDDCELGAIARTFLNSIVVDPTIPRWTIVGKDYTPVLGQILTKQGRTTGRSEAPLVATCLDVQVSGTNIIRLCQNLVAAPPGGALIWAGGDAGSPVFAQLPGSDHEVELVGLQWGGMISGDQYVYTPLRLLEREFGRRFPVHP